MRENNDLDILMQLKMEEFLMEPTPADWQAIYDQLHPKKRRRFIWWWIPLAAGLSLFGAYWMFSGQRENHNFIQQSENNTPASTPENSTNPVPTEQVINPTPENKKPDLSKQSQTPISGSAVVAERSQKPEPPGSQQLRKTTSGGNTEQHRSEPVQNSDAPNQSELTRNSDSKTTAGLNDADKANTVLIDSTSIAVAPLTSTENPKSQEGSPEPSKPAAPEDPLDKTIDPAPQATSGSIPNLSNHAEKGWYLGVYSGVGVNNPTEPISMTKSLADVSNLPGSSSTYSTVNNADKSGLHFSFGLAVERKWKKTSFSTGIGLQHNTWSSSQTIYRDSISAGNFFSRTAIANNTVNYRHFALEIPMILNIKIAGKTRSSYWLNAGLNNAFSLALNKSSTAPAQLSGSLDNSQSDLAIYQPQLRLGLMYENTRKSSHWQLSPFIQYGLTNMTRSGSPDARLLHLGILGRYYFKKLQ